MKRIKSASLDITYKCNLRCKHCYNFSGSQQRAELSSAQIVNIAHQMAEREFESICICGGEPLIRKDDLINFASIIKENSPNTIISMVSNGILWDNDIAHQLYSAGVSHVQFSLDGITDESYDFIRNSHGCLTRVFNAIQIAKYVGFTVMVSMLPHKKSISEIDRIVQFCLKSGISELRIQPLMPLGRGEINYDELVITDEDYCFLSNRLHELNQLTNDLTITWGDPLDHFFGYIEAGYIYQLVINAYGEIMVSPYLPFSIWDLKKQQLNDYFSKDIPSLALQIDVVKDTLTRCLSVTDFTSHIGNLPTLFLEENYQIDVLEELKV